MVEKHNFEIGKIKIYRNFTNFLRSLTVRVRTWSGPVRTGLVRVLDFCICKNGVRSGSGPGLTRVRTFQKNEDLCVLWFKTYENNIFRIIIGFYVKIHRKIVFLKERYVFKRFRHKSTTFLPGNHS